MQIVSVLCMMDVCPCLKKPPGSVLGSHNPFLDGENEHLTKNIDSAFFSGCFWQCIDRVGIPLARLGSNLKGKGSSRGPMPKPKCNVKVGAEMKLGLCEELLWELNTQNGSQRKVFGLCLWRRMRVFADVSAVDSL